MIDLQNFLNSLHCLGSDGELIDYCRKYVLHGTPYIFINREDEYYDFRKRIAKNCNISFNVRIQVKNSRSRTEKYDNVVR